MICTLTKKDLLGSVVQRRVRSVEVAAPTQPVGRPSHSDLASSDCRSSKQQAMFVVIGPDGCPSACAVKELVLAEPQAEPRQADDANEAPLQASESMLLVT